MIRYSRKPVNNILELNYEHLFNVKKTPIVFLKDYGLMRTSEYAYALAQKYEEYEYMNCTNLSHGYEDTKKEILQSFNSGKIIIVDNLDVNLLCETYINLLRQYDECVTLGNEFSGGYVFIITDDIFCEKINLNYKDKQTEKEYSIMSSRIVVPMSIREYWLKTGKFTKDYESLLTAYLKWIEASYIDYEHDVQLFSQLKYKKFQFKEMYFYNKGLLQSSGKIYDLLDNIVYLLLNTYESVEDKRRESLIHACVLGALCKLNCATYVKDDSIILFDNKHLWLYIGYFDSFIKSSKTVLHDMNKQANWKGVKPVALFIDTPSDLGHRSNKWIDVDIMKYIESPESIFYYIE